MDGDGRRWTRWQRGRVAHLFTILGHADVLLLSDGGRSLVGDVRLHKHTFNGRWAKKGWEAVVVGGSTRGGCRDHHAGSCRVEGWA